MIGASIFRPEAVEHRRQAWLGSIQLVRPLSLSLLTGAVVVALGLTLATLSWGEYTRKARVGGVLVPEGGVVRLLPPQAAVVLERLADEGQRVRAGDVLFVLSLDRATAGGDAQAQVQRTLAARERSLADTARQQHELLDAQRAALERRLADMRNEARQIGAEIDLHRQRLALAQQSLLRLQDLQREQFISSAQVQARSEEVLGLQAQGQALARQRAAHEREMATVEAELRELPLRARAREAEIAREVAEVQRLAAESEAQRRVVVRAPHDGVLTAVVAEPGQAVSPATALASVVPGDSALLAHLYAPSSAIGFVRPDQPVLLRYQAFPYQKFGHHHGRVLQVSRTPLHAGEMAGGASADGEPMYRITVALDRQTVPAYGSEQPLAAGMQLDADVLLDRRRLIEWIFEPVLSVTGRI
ncbi:HlyD family efflux transporter periplasmic adaptor subunit [Azohydromonas sp.]|uniref:HlyD family secretion protein n=1 Tax=Azohydromonas sp. TaxID=1872666 RepID=UPI002CB2AFE0|nr:HlyD family efflux transporter periplasmic adaptor subunit [Azohydromonas sp.]HMM85474.1 HlyD family efflux transporter periplasmic adaptor subunit [Azohydromonas sp.]